MEYRVADTQELVKISFSKKIFLILFIHEQT